jgi:hypothetical protein
MIEEPDENAMLTRSIVVSIAAWPLLQIAFTWSMSALSHLFLP